MMTYPKAEMVKKRHMYIFCSCSFNTYQWLCRCLLSVCVVYNSVMLRQLFLESLSGTFVIWGGEGSWPGSLM